MDSPTSQLLHALLTDLSLTSVPSCFPARDDKFAANYLAYNIVRKLEPYKSKDEVPNTILSQSLSDFADSEWRCAVVNRHGRFYSTLVKDDSIFFSEALRLAKYWINDALCDVWPRWDARYTSGASRQSTRKTSLPCLKWSGIAEFGKLSTTASALFFMEQYVIPDYGQSWQQFGHEFREDSRFSFVQKSATKVRFMAMEPEYNMIVQQNFGDCIRYALLQRGFNLNSQTLNQDMAFLGSLFRNRATIDLTNSSECLATFLLSLLPCRWQHWLMGSRTPYTSVGTVRHKLEKIATQGNGFIFELQSLLYAGLVYAVTTLKGGREDDMAVYGDDIVISSHCAKPLMDLLIYLGMQPNMTKSYWDVDEPFRESCGKHFLAGRDVTPFYVKEPIGPLHTIFRAYNGLKYWEERTGYRLPKAIAYLVSLLSVKERVLVPRSFSITSGLHWPCKKCVFPKKLVKLGELRATFMAYTDVIDDVTERIGDATRLRWWLYQPPAELIDRRFYPHSTMHGYPREQHRVSRGLPSGSSAMRWGRRETFPGDALNG